MAGVHYDEEAGRSSSSRVLPFASTPSPRSFALGERQEKKSKLNFFQLLSQKLGLRDLFNLQVWRASVGELIGTAVLVFCLDAIVVSSSGSGFKPPGLLAAILVFLVVSVILLAVSPISGGHMNPAVTLAATLVGIVSPAHALLYVAAQCAGACLGALAIRAIVDEAIQAAFSLGGCTLSTTVPGRDGILIRVGVETETAFWLEFVCTFILLFGSIWMAFDVRQAKALGRQNVCMVIGLVIGLMSFVSSTITGQKGYGGVGLNPARCLGPAIVRGGHLWNGHWVFWAGPSAASLAFYLYTKLVPADHFHGSHEFKYDAFTTLRAVGRSVLCGNY